MCTMQKCLVVKLGNRLTSYCNYQKDFWSVCTHKLGICMYTRTHQAQDSGEFCLPLLVTFCFMILALNFLFVIPRFPYWKLRCWTRLMKAKCLLIVTFQGEIVMSRIGFQRMLQKPTSETHFWQCPPHAAAPRLRWTPLIQPALACPWFSCSPVATRGFATCWGTYIESTPESC